MRELVLPTVGFCVTTLSLTTHMVVDIFGVKVIDVDDDAMFVTSTTLPFPLSFRVGVVSLALFVDTHSPYVVHCTCSIGLEV